MPSHVPMTFPFDDFVAFGRRQAMEETGETAYAHYDWRVVFRVLLRLLQILNGCHVPLENHATLLENSLENGVQSIALSECRVQVPHAGGASKGAGIVQ